MKSKTNEGKRSEEFGEVGVFHHTPIPKGEKEKKKKK